MAKPSRTAIQSEVHALRKRTEHLSNQLNKVRDLCSLLSSRFSTYRTAFCLQTLVNEVVAKHKNFKVIGDSQRRGTDPREMLAFADPTQVRCCIEETLAAVATGEPVGEERVIELVAGGDQGKLKIIVWDGSTLDNDSFRRLRDRWLGSQWSISTAAPDFLLGLGLTRERLRHNGGDLRVVREMGKGIGLELSVPCNQLRAVLASYQSLIRRKLPNLSELSIFTARLEDGQFLAQGRSTITEFIQTNMGSLGLAIPLDQKSWAVLAPVQADERETFVSWLESQWEQLVAIQDEDRPNPSRSIKLLIAPLATVGVDTPVENWAEQLDAESHVNLTQEVIQVSDDVREDNLRLQETQPETSTAGGRPSVPTTAIRREPSERATTTV